jgi:hypothetical protein
MPTNIKQLVIYMPEAAIDVIDAQRGEDETLSQAGRRLLATALPELHEHMETVKPRGKHERRGKAGEHASKKHHSLGTFIAEQVRLARIDLSQMGTIDADWPPKEIE